MDHHIVVPEVMETEPGSIMPEVLIDLDFEHEGQHIPPARMSNGASCCSSSSCTLPPTRN